MLNPQLVVTPQPCSDHLPTTKAPNFHPPPELRDEVEDDFPGICWCFFFKHAFLVGKKSCWFIAAGLFCSQSKEEAKFLKLLKLLTSWEPLKNQNISSRSVEGTEILGKILVVGKVFVVCDGFCIPTCKMFVLDHFCIYSLKRTAKARENWW